MNYPTKPWTNGQTFTENGTVYVYNATTNAWEFSPITYNRVENALMFTVPSTAMSLRVEFSSEMDFSTSSATFDTTVSSNIARFVTFDNNGVYATLATAGTIDPSSFSKIVLFPTLDMSTRYYGRYRWGSSGAWKPVVYPVGSILP